MARSVMLGGLVASCLLVAPLRADPLDEYLDKAERSMQESADSLRGKNADQSVNHQSATIRELERYLSSELQQDQQALRDRLQELKKKLAERGINTDQQQPGQNGDQAEQGDGDSFAKADGAMGDAGSQLGEGDSDSAADSQGKALDALRKGAKSLADAMQQGDGDQPGDGPGQRMGRQQGNGQTDPLGRPMQPSRDVDDFSQKIPGEIDVQRVRRILEELRRRLADPNRPQIELDYIERLLKDN